MTPWDIIQIALTVLCWGQIFKTQINRGEDQNKKTKFRMSTITLSLINKWRPVPKWVAALPLNQELFYTEVYVSGRLNKIHVCFQPWSDHSTVNLKDCIVPRTRNHRGGRGDDSPQTTKNGNFSKMSGCLWLWNGIRDSDCLLLHWRQHVSEPTCTKEWVHNVCPLSESTSHPRTSWSKIHKRLSQRNPILVLFFSSRVSHRCYLHAWKHEKMNNLQKKFKEILFCRLRLHCK